MFAPHRPWPAVIAVLFALTACDSTAASAPGRPAQPESLPTSTQPSSQSGDRESLGPEAGAGACPSARALEKLADLPTGWHFVPSSVKCWKGWATADPEGPNPGDGIYLFRHGPSTGWRYHSQGSGYFCPDLGINEPAPFCQYP